MTKLDELEALFAEAAQWPRSSQLHAAIPALIAIARAATWVRKAYELDEGDNDVAAEFCAALDQLETNQ